MSIGLKQQLRLTQQLVMTPQLQQAIKLLQLNQLELVNMVEQELQENPVLEEEEREEDTPAEITDATPSELSEMDAVPVVPDAEGSTSPDGDPPAELMDPAAEPDFGGDESLAPETSEPTDPSDAEKIADIEWDNYMDSHPQTGLEDSDGETTTSDASLEATLTRRPTLAEHLEWQIQLSDFSDETEIQIAHWIIGNLDDRGYLRSTVDEIARQAGIACHHGWWRRVLAKIQLTRSGSEWLRGIYASA